MPPGPLNAITDVPGILVGHCTLIWDAPRIARTGVTMVVPRSGAIWQNRAFAGHHTFNGNGEMTGLLWLEESGMLDGPIGLTNTHAVGVVRDAIVAYGVKHGYVDSFMLPVVAETYDGWLNDIDAFHVTREHAFEALAAARAGTVAEGSVGGGTGMRCHGSRGASGRPRAVSIFRTRSTRWERWFRRTTAGWPISGWMVCRSAANWRSHGRPRVPAHRARSS
jgi:D-aminopeptidase